MHPENRYTYKQMRLPIEEKGDHFYNSHNMHYVAFDSETWKQDLEGPGNRDVLVIAPPAFYLPESPN